MSCTTLDTETVLEMSGESQAADVREAVLRNMGFTALDVQSLCREPWGRLEALSLSKNPLGASSSQLWQWLHLCSTLRCLNLNFCEIESLEVNKQHACISLYALFYKANVAGYVRTEFVRTTLSVDE